MFKETYKSFGKKFREFTDEFIIGYVKARWGICNLNRLCTCSKCVSNRTKITTLFEQAIPLGDSDIDTDIEIEEEIIQ